MKINKKYLLLALPFLIFASAAAAQVTVSTNIPGVPANNTNACTTVFGFYNFALMIGGILAFGAIIYGGVKYTFAAGNPGGQSEGKEYIKSAILGLLLLVGAYTVLNIINPDIVSCKLPQLGTFQPSGFGSTVTSCPAGQFMCSITTRKLDGTPPVTDGVCVSDCASECNCNFNSGSDPSGNPLCTVNSCAATGAATSSSMFKNCTPFPGTGLGDCAGTGCVRSASLNTFISCVGGSVFGGGGSSVFSTFGATTGDGTQHTCNVTTGKVSCHFGGTGCFDGGHAVDFRRSDLVGSGPGQFPTMDAALLAIQAKSCSVPFSCRCESGPGPSICPVADHIHCNVNTGLCSCP